jgi:hypothetical protein
MASMEITSEDADVIIKWPDGQVSQGRVTPVLSEYAPSEWMGGELLEHVRARGLSATERQAIRVQIADAETEFRICMARKAGPLSPEMPRVDVRVILGRAGDQRVEWLSRDEIASRMRAMAGAMAGEIAAANARAAKAEDKWSLFEQVGYLSGLLESWTKRLQEEADRAGGVERAK